MNPERREFNCMEKEELFAYATGMLGPEEERRVEAHGVSCRRCRKIVQGYRCVGAILDEWKTPEPSPWFDARLRSRFRAAQATRSPWGALRLRWGLGGLPFGAHWLVPALTMAVVISSAILLVRVRGSEQGPHTAAHRSASVMAQAGRKAGSSPQEQEDLANGQDQLENGSGPTVGAEAGPTAQDDEMLANFDVLSELPAPHKESSQADN